VVIRPIEDGLAMHQLHFKAEVRDLKQGYSALEERARTDLQMVGVNETFFLVVPASSPGSAPMAPAAAPTRTAAR